VTFPDRHEAGRRLAERVAEVPSIVPTLLVGVHPGGIAVASACALRLGLPSGGCGAAHLRLPWRPAIPFGALTDDGHRYLDAEVVADHSLAPREIDEVAGRAWHTPAGERPPRPRLARQAVLVVADGLSTGYRALAVAAAAQAAGAADVTIAVPCCAADAAARVAAAGIRLVSLFVVDGPRFHLGAWYGDDGAPIVVAA
jgi:putative phosphoribosyl transferase